MGGEGQVGRCMRHEARRRRDSNTRGRAEADAGLIDARLAEGHGTMTVRPDGTGPGHGDGGPESDGLAPSRLDVPAV